MKTQSPPNALSKVFIVVCGIKMYINNHRESFTDYCTANNDDSSETISVYKKAGHLFRIHGKWNANKNFSSAVL